MWLSADGLRDIRLVLWLVAESDSLKLILNQHLRLQPDCQPLDEAQLEVSIRPLQPAEAVVLAYCWKCQFFDNGCQQRIFNILYKCFHPSEPVFTCPDDDAAVHQLLQAVEQPKWKPGLQFTQEIQDCFPSGHTGDLVEQTVCYICMCVACVTKHNTASTLAQDCTTWLTF